MSTTPYLETWRTIPNSSGPDGIPARLLHEYANHIAPALTKIFQISVNTGTIPDEWRSTSIVPVFKKGDRHQASNYRPVSPTSIACKLLEHIVHSQVDHYDRHNIMSDKQHGFKSKRSCETQLSVTIDSIARTRADGGQVDIILLTSQKRLTL